MKHKSDTLKDYHQRINKVILYINNHLSEDLNLNQLASYSNFSVYHFHRIMRAYLGEPIGNYILRLRLEAAARLLMFTQDQIADIAWKTAYETPSAFTNAFKNRFGLSPLEFRNSAVNNHNFNLISKMQNNMQMEIKPLIKKIETKKVIYFQVTDTYGSEKTAYAWERICGYMKEKNLFSFGMECIGVSHDDPSVTEPEKCRYDACLTVKQDVKPDGEIGFKQIEGGRYAIFRYIGPYERLNEVYNYIYHSWLPSSGYELRDLPCFEKYLNSPDKHKPEDLKTHIYLPLK